MELSKQLLDKINAAVEADQIAFKQAADNLNLTLNEGAISGRRQGYFKGYSDAIGEIETLKAENSKMRKALEELTNENNKLSAENHTLSEELGELQNINEGLMVKLALNSKRV